MNKIVNMSIGFFLFANVLGVVRLPGQNHEVRAGNPNLVDPLPSAPKFITVRSDEELLKSVEEACKDKKPGEMLVLIDIDNTLLMSGRDSYFSKLPKTHYCQWTKEEEVRDFVSHASLEDDLECRPVYERAFGTIFKIVKEKGIPTVALTASFGGEYGRIRHAEDLRQKQLEKLKLSFVGLSSFEDTQFGAEEFSFSPPAGERMIKNNVAYVAWAKEGQSSKGKGIEALVKRCKAPCPVRYVVLIDDKETELEVGQAACKELGIGFIGILSAKAKEIMENENYQGAEEKNRKNLDARWFNDSETKERFPYFYNSARTVSVLFSSIAENWEAL